MLQNPLDKELTEFTAYSRNKVLRARLNNVDFWINAIMTTIAVLLLLPTLHERDFVILLLMWYLFLGAYQMISAAVGAIRGDVHKAWYFFAGIAVVFGFVSGLDSAFDNDYTVLTRMMITGLPTGMALLYTKLCYDAKIRTAL